MLRAPLPLTGRRTGLAGRVLALFSLLLATCGMAVPPDLDLENLRQRLGDLRSQDGAPSGDRAEMVDSYQQAIGFLESAAEDRAEAERFAEVLRTADAELQRVRDQLGRDDEPLRPPDTSEVEELERQLLDAQSDRERLRSELAELQVTARTEQSADLNALLSEASRQLEEARLTDRAGDESSPLAEAHRTLAASRIEAAEARLAMLNQRQLSRPPRQDLRDLRARLVNRQLVRAEQQVVMLLRATNAARQEEARQAELRAIARSADIGQGSAEAQRLAEANTQMARHLTRITERTEELANVRNRVDAERERIDRYYENISQQLEVAGADRHEALGEELLAQRHRLAQIDRAATDLDGLAREITGARLAQLRLQDQQNLDAERAPATSQLLRELLAEHDALLQRLVSGYRRYLDTLSATRNQAVELEKITESYRTLLDARLFWIPSTAPISLGSSLGLGHDLATLFSPRHWRAVVAAVTQQTLDDLLALVLALVSVLLMQRRLMLRGVITRQAAWVGNVVQDRASYTWLALVFSLLMALPGPLLLLALSIPLDDGTLFTDQLASGLRSAAALLFLLEAFRQIARPAGLAELHFRWSEHALKVLRGNLQWFIAFIVPVALLTPLVDPQSDPDMGDTASRFVFAIASLALALFAHRMLRPRHGVLARLAPPTATWQQVLRFVVHPLAVLLPVLLLVLSAAGYHYTALSIEERLFISACEIGGATLLYYLIVRAVAVTERRMALERLRARRLAERELQSSRRAADDAAQGVPDNLDLPQQDLAQVNAQTRAIIRMVVLAGIIVALWQLWADALPALGVLDDFTLWQVTGDAGQPERNITLGTLLLAAIIGFFTFFAARNVPGLLEVSVLRGMRLQPGTGYAVRTVVTYVIVTAGLIYVLNTIGAQWSKLQWLVAALGVGLGFGLQEIVANFVSGVMILFEQPIRVGDTVTVGPHTGTVTRIRIRATTLTDWDRKEQIIPNRTFITEQLTNWTLTDPITRVVIRVGVAYGSEVDAVHALLTEVVRDNDRVIDDPPPAVFFVSFGESSLQFELRVFVRNMLDIMPLTHELHVAIAAAFARQGIEIPFPQRDVWIRSEPPGPEPD